jgi:hypothetical protein
MNAVQEIPLNKLVPSAANVRKTGIEELAASIGAHGLLQTLLVQPVFNRDGAATGKFAVVAGGRRPVAMKLLATREAVAKMPRRLHKCPPASTHGAWPVVLNSRWRNAWLTAYSW